MDAKTDKRFRFAHVKCASSGLFAAIVGYHGGETEMDVIVGHDWFFKVRADAFGEGTEKGKRIAEVLNSIADQDLETGIALAFACGGGVCGDAWRLRTIGVEVKYAE